MRLRYLRVKRNLQVLTDLILAFPQDPLLSAQPLALRFVVGLNGSGKTTLLQTLAVIFASLDRDAQAPSFPFWLAYDMDVGGRTRTVYICAPGTHPPTLVVFDEMLPLEIDWAALTSVDPQTQPWPVRVFREFKDDEPVEGKYPVSLPAPGEMDAFLPSAVLAYTSADTRDWEVLFGPADFPLDESIQAAVSLEDERPPDWDVSRENQWRQRERKDLSLLEAASPTTAAARQRRPSHSFLIATPQLALAATLVILQHLANDGHDESLQAIFNELRLPWQSPLALSLWVNLDLLQLDSTRAVIVADLMKLAANMTREPEPSEWRQLIFDPVARVPEGDYNANPPPEEEKEKTDTKPDFRPHRIIPGERTVKALVQLLGGTGGTVYDVFRTLCDWEQNGFICDVRLVLRKNDVEDALLFDWLSDGEQMLLGRVALFYLLRDKRDALLILDEPETHFNDAWKRRLVDMLDDALRDYAHQVVISTHSSILLSDVFNTEMTVLRIDGGVEEPPAGTFGTLPSEIMRNIFQADNPVGDRAREFLDAVLTLVEYRELANALWRALGETPNPEVDAWIGDQHPFGRLVQIFGERERAGRLPHRTPHQWLRLFQGLHRRAAATGQPVTLAIVLETLFGYVGAGYYQFELRRQHRYLVSGENVASG